LGPGSSGAILVGMSDEQDDDPQAEPSPGNGEEMDKPRRGRPENLKPIQPGEVRNPKGINGRAQREAFVAWADQPDPTLTGDKSRIQAVDDAILKKALKGGDQAQKLFVEQYRGRARQHVQVTGENDGPVRITYDHVRQKLDAVARAAIGATAATADGDPDAGDPPTDED
jgi:hypothetical protein